MNESEALVGRTFSIDLSDAPWVEPPGVGAIFGSQLEGIAVLMAATDDSDLDAGAQPGVHVIVAAGEFVGGGATQDPCATTSVITAGADGEVGTGDDAPATWTNPTIEVGPLDFPEGTLEVQGIATGLQDVSAATTFHPELADARGGFFEGTIDTRPIAPELDPDGGEDAVCQLLFKTVGVECVECGGDDPGEFCLVIRAEDVVSEHEPGVTIEPTTCADVIDAFETGGQCDSEAASYDEDGDGTYELCPEWGGR